MLTCCPDVRGSVTHLHETVTSRQRPIIERRFVKCSDKAAVSRSNTAKSLAPEWAEDANREITAQESCVCEHGSRMSTWAGFEIT